VAFFVSEDPGGSGEWGIPSSIAGPLILFASAVYEKKKGKEIAMKKMIVVCCWLSICLGSVHLVLAATGKNPESRLEEIVVTATRTDRDLKEIPARVEVITGEEIRQRAGSSSKVDDILQYLSGVTVVRGNGIYSLGASATLRGLSNEGARTLVLIDGVPINKSDTGEVNFNRIDLNQIERIEVFKGPASSLYGNNAMGGVINIITVKPVTPFQAEANGFYGSNQTFGGNLALTAKSGKEDSGFFAKATAHYLDSDGYISTPEGKKTPYTVKRFVREEIGNFSMGYDFNRLNTLGVTIDYFNDKRGEGTKIRAEDGVSRDFDTWAYTLRHQGGMGDLRWQAKAFWQNENYRRVSESLRGTQYTRFDVDSDRTDMGVDGSFTIPFSGQNVLTIGGDVREGMVKAADIYQTSPDRAENEGKLRIYGLWLQDEWTVFKDKLYLVGGLRFDHARFFDGNFYSTLSPFNQLNGKQEENRWTALSPRLSLRYRWTPALSAYASYGRGFRASILDDLCRSGIMWGIYKVANPKLEPEKIDTFETGFDYTLSERLKLGSSIYYSLGTDFLYYVPTGAALSGRPLYRRENIDRVVSYGLEADARYLINKSLNTFLNYTYNKATIDRFAQRPAIEGQELTRTPNHQIKAGVTWIHQYLNVTLLGRYKSSQYVYTNEMTQTVAKISDYVTFDLKLWKEIGKGLALSLNVENLLNRDYMESADDKAPGLFVLGRVGYRF